jgi:hypothetical protein
MSCLAKPSADAKQAAAALSAHPKFATGRNQTGSFRAGRAESCHSAVDPSETFPSRSILSGSARRTRLLSRLSHRQPTRATRPADVPSPAARDRCQNRSLAEGDLDQQVRELFGPAVADATVNTDPGGQAAIRTTRAVASGFRKMSGSRLPADHRIQTSASFTVECSPISTASLAWRAVNGVRVARRKASSIASSQWDGSDKAAVHFHVEEHGQHARRTSRRRINRIEQK